MELFSEVYGCYFTVISRLLKQAEEGLTKAEIEQFIGNHGFHDSAFHLLPALFNGEWDLFYEVEGRYYPKVCDGGRRPYTKLEKAWLKALLRDPRIRLFLDDDQYQQLAETLIDIPPLFEQQDFYIYDQHRDGDDYRDSGYQERFRIILKAIKEKRLLLIDYEGGSGKRMQMKFFPHRLCYSARDDKFRLKCAAIWRQRGRKQQYTLNLARIIDVQMLDDRFEEGYALERLREETETESVSLEIFSERNALERCMMQFASYKRQTEYDKERNVYKCRIWYDPVDETELLIRILSFGPVVKVLGPEKFLRQVKQRIGRQMDLLGERREK